jgi:hypothetical protein
MHRYGFGGVHVVGGPRNGFGEFLRVCAVANEPVIVKAVDQNVYDEVKKHNSNNIVIFRTNKHGEPSYYANPDTWMQLLVEEWAKNPADFYEPSNELSPGCIPDMVAYNSFTGRCIEIANDRGLKLCVQNWSTGTPSDDDGIVAEERYSSQRSAWEAAADGGHLLGLHEYGLEGMLKASSPDHALRYRRVIKWLGENGLGHLKIVITEAGQHGGYGFRGWTYAMEDIEWYLKETRRDPQVLGHAWWTLGDWHEANCQGILPALAEFLANNPAPWHDSPTPGLCRNRPREDYRREYWLIDESVKGAAASKIASEAVERSHTVGRSADDAFMGDLDERVVRVFGWPMGEQAILVKWANVHYPGPPPAKISFCDVDEETPIPPTDKKCLVGVHGRADGPMFDADFEAIRIAKVDAVKVLVGVPPDQISRIKAARATNPDFLFLSRLFADFKNRVVSSNDFAEWQKHDMERQYGLGIRLFEIHNEPNLYDEGYGSSWSDGREFARWWIEVRDILRNLFPEALFGFPGCSPGESRDYIRYNMKAFLDDAGGALLEADWLGAHSYWLEEEDMDHIDHGFSWKQVAAACPACPLYLTEFSNSNNGVNYVKKAAQYLKFYELLQGSGVEAAFCFVLSASNPKFQSEVWRLEGGFLTAIPLAVGSRHL